MDHPTHRETAELLRSNDLIGIGMEADKARQKLHPEGIVSYTVQGEVDLARAEDIAALFEQVQHLTASGMSSLVLAGELRDGIGLKQCADLVRRLKQISGIGISGFSPQQLAGLAAGDGVSLDDAIAQLRDAGLDSIGAQGFPVSGYAASQASTWRQAHRSAHKAAMRTTATLVFEAGEPVERRIEALETIACIQNETGGFVSVAPTFVQGSGEEPTAVEYLKVLAVSRLYLPEIPHCEDSWRGAGLKVCQIGLRFGGNDLGCAGPPDSATGGRQEPVGVAPGELRRIIRDAGFAPKERDASYTTYFLN